VEKYSKKKIVGRSPDYRDLDHPVAFYNLLGDILSPHYLPEHSIFSVQKMRLPSYDVELAFYLNL